MFPLALVCEAQGPLDHFSGTFSAIWCIENVRNKKYVAETLVKSNHLNFVHYFHNKIQNFNMAHSLQHVIYKKWKIKIIFEESLYLFEKNLHLIEDRLTSWQLETRMTKLNYWKLFKKTGKSLFLACVEDMIEPKMIFFVLFLSLFSLVPSFSSKMTSKAKA